jgi:hypothetical protein
MKAGHSRPSSNARAVPETAPTANRTAVTLPHVWARCSRPESPVRSQAASAISIISGTAMPAAAKIM